MKLLNEIPQKMKVPKAQENKFGEYKYRSVSDILAAVKPFLGTGTLTLSNKMIVVGDKRYVEATATLSDGHESVSVTAHAREDEIRKKMNPEQLTGAASSYARKYALDGLFATDDMPDADATNRHDGNNDTPKPGKAKPSEVRAALYAQYCAAHASDIADHFSLPPEVFTDLLNAEVKKRYPTVETMRGLACTVENLMPIAEAAVTPKLAEILVEDK